MQKLNYNEIELNGLGKSQKQDYLFEELMKDVFTLQDFTEDISLRKLNVWNNEDLLLEKSEKGKRRKFNFIEYSWIRIIHELRKFEIGFTIIRKLKGYLMEPIALDYIFEEEGMGDLLKLIPEENRDMAKKILLEKRMNLLVKQRLKWRVHTSKLFLLVFDAIAQKKQTTILVNIDGYFLPITDAGLARASQMEGYMEFINNHHFSCSLTTIISKFLQDNYFGGNKSKVNLLTKDEEEILKVIRSGNCKEISIKYQNDKLNRIDVTTTGKVDSAKRLIEMIMTNGYQDISLSTENGKIVHYENKRKIKI